MREYTIRISDDSVQSKHDALVRLAQGSRKARKMERDDVECDGPDEAVAQYLALLVHEESNRRSAR